MTRRPALRLSLVAVAVALATGALGTGAAAPTDPIAAELARLAGRVERDTTSGDVIWDQVRPGSIPLLRSARVALERGRRWLALQRLGAARTNVVAAAALRDLGVEAQEDSAAFEADWAGSAREFAAMPRTLARARPAVVRALGEAALAQADGYREASLEYGRNTDPRNGRFYLGAARAQRSFATLCLDASSPARGRAPSLRPIGRELDALEAELLAAYRPPASLERHLEFIGASATLKEARELDAAGVRHGALLRYLQAAARIAPLRDTLAAVPARDSLERAIEAFERRLAGTGTDHSIAELLLETARSILEDTARTARPADAAALVRDVVPRYLAALEPASPAAAAAAPEVTVTLVRWPYT